MVLMIAIAFGFFEQLLKLGDVNRIGMEHARVASLNGLLSMAGIASYIYEDFTEVTFDLFKIMAAGKVDVAALVNYFNDESCSNAIVMHFRVNIFTTATGRRANRAPVNN